MNLNVRTFAIFLCFAAFVTSCGDDDTDEPGDNFDRQGMLNNLSNNYILPEYQSYLATVDQLRDSKDEFLSSSSIPDFESLRSDFLDAYRAWQRVSFLELGPAEQVSLRSALNNFPIDDSKLEANINESDFNLDALSNGDVQGFPALDYLLFEPDLTTAEVVDRFTNGTSGVQRGQYLTAVVDKIHSLSDQAVNGWLATNGNYLSTFMNSTGIAVGSSMGLIVNSFNLHYERNFRDGKIGIPVGIRSLGISIPENSEAFYSGISLELAIANFEAMVEFYRGANGLGLDDNLVAVGAQDLVTSIDVQIAAVNARLQGLSDPLSDQIENNQAAVEEAYQEIQRLLILFKVDMPSRLAVLITFEDNDGD